MKTLKELVIEAKCRKGEAHGTTKRGAYWCPFMPDGKAQYFSRTASRGGDGIGNNAADVRVGLDLRHFRDGTVSAVLVRESWHQNYGTSKETTNADQLLSCATAEEVIVALRGIELINDSGPALGKGCIDDVIADCVAIGMPKAAPAPDEA